MDETAEDASEVKEEGKAQDEGEPRSFKDGLRGLNYPLIILVVAVAAYFILFTLLSLYRYSNFRCQAIDFAIFDQVLWKLSRFKGATVSIRGQNLFGDHMAPILFLLVPLYWIKANIPGLIVVQTGALALGAVPIYLLARDRLKSGALAVALSVSYLLYPALQYLNSIDFHTEVLAVPFLLFAFLYLDRRRYLLFILFCGLTLLCKEDLAFIVFLLGAVAFFSYDKKAGAIVAGGSLGYFLVMVAGVMPRLTLEGYLYGGRLSQFGKTPTSAVKNMIVHPGRTFRIVATKFNLKYLVDLLAPVAFLPLLAPLVALPALAPLGVNIISNFAPQHDIFHQYTAGIIPFAFIGAVFAVGKIISWERVAGRRRQAVALLTVAVVAFALVSSILLGPSPISVKFNGRLYTGDRHVESIRRGLDIIPKSASVSSQTFLIGHLSERERIYMFPSPFVDMVSKKYFDSLSMDEKRFIFPRVYNRRQKGKNTADYPVPKVDYVALDLGTGTWPLPPEEYNDVVEGLEKAGYRRVYSGDGVLILKRGD